MLRNSYCLNLKLIRMVLTSYDIETISGSKLGVERNLVMIGALGNIVRFVSLLFGGLFAGFLLTVLVLESTLRTVGATEYTQVRQVELVRLDDLASATLFPTVVATAILVALGARRRGRVFWLTLAALLLLVTVLATTLIFNLPINTDQLSWNVQTPPADWATVRDHWQTAHAVRTGAALLAFGCLSLAAMRASLTTGQPRRLP
jgi:uncharacterized membrane protein